MSQKIRGVNPLCLSVEHAGHQDRLAYIAWNDISLDRSSDKVRHLPFFISISATLKNTAPVPIRPWSNKARLGDLGDPQDVTLYSRSNMILQSDNYSTSGMPGSSSVLAIWAMKSGNTWKSRWI